MLRISDVELQIRNFEMRFCNLQVDTEKELKKRNKTVETISAKLRALPPRLNKDYHKYTRKLSRKPNTIEDLFGDLSVYCWNCFEYELLEFVIRINNCSKMLENRMKDYASDLKKFKDSTTLSEFIKYGQQFFLDKEPPQKYSKLVTKNSVNPNEITLTSLDHIRERIWKSNSKLSECVMLIHTVMEGCVEIEWLVSEEYDYEFMTFFCSEAGKELLEEYEITKISINNIPICHSVCDW